MNNVKFSIFTNVTSTAVDARSSARAAAMPANPPPSTTTRVVGVTRSSLRFTTVTFPRNGGSNRLARYTIRRTAGALANATIVASTVHVPPIAKAICRSKAFASAPMTSEPAGTRPPRIIA